MQKLIIARDNVRQISVVVTPHVVLVVSTNKRQFR